MLEVHLVVRAGGPHHPPSRQQYPALAAGWNDALVKVWVLHPRLRLESGEREQLAVLHAVRCFSNVGDCSSPHVTERMVAVMEHDVGAVKGDVRGATRAPNKATNDQHRPRISRCGTGVHYDTLRLDPAGFTSSVVAVGHDATSVDIEQPNVVPQVHARRHAEPLLVVRHR